MNSYFITFNNIVSLFYDNKIFKGVLILIVFDCFVGIIRAFKEKKYNSCVGIDGVIRKMCMVVTIVFMRLVDSLISLNLIGFLSPEVREFLNVESVSVSDFFGILFIMYETVSVLKNMTLCGLPTKKITIYLRELLSKYTDELPETDEIEEEEESNEC